MPELGSWGLLLLGMTTFAPGTQGASLESTGPGRPDAFDTSGSAPEAQAPEEQRSSTGSVVASYTIHARLDEESHTIYGEETIVFRNPSSEPTDELYFHLYLNAFENSESLYSRTLSPGASPDPLGSIEVKSLHAPLFGTDDLWPNAESHSPNDKKDRTNIRLPLPRPLQGNQELVLKLKFVSQLPGNTKRTGFHDEFHFVGQWYPKLAKREPDGTWAHFPYHSLSEYYADFGNYRVRLDVPAHFIVGSSGTQTLEESANGRSLYLSEASHVHDFAWTAWPHFQVEERTLSRVAIRLMTPDFSPRLKQATWQTLNRGLSYLSTVYGPYPYPTLTIVQPPRSSMFAGGMEYPRLFTTNGSELRALLGFRTQEVVTIHELAHQWFQGMVASNENAFPFLDEGITSYVEHDYLTQVFGPTSFANVWGVAVSSWALTRYSHFRYSSPQKIASTAVEFSSKYALANLAYARSALCLETLARVYSREQLNQALGIYARRWRFSHPRPADLYDIFEEVLGPEARVQAELMFESQGTLDLLIQEAPQMSGDGLTRTSVIIEQKGTLRLPFMVEATFEDGHVEQQQVDSAETHIRLIYENSHPVTKIHVDPRRRILLDENLLNNRRYLDSSSGRTTQGLSGFSLASWALLLLSP